MPTREEEPRRRRKHDADRERDRERESTTPREKHRHTSHRAKSSSHSKLPLTSTTSKTGSKERLDRDRESPRPSTSSGRPSPRKVSVLLPEMDRRPSGDLRQAPAYPTFSKAHSREAVGSREDISSFGKSGTLYTPDATEVGKEERRRTDSAPTGQGSTVRSPPSPPLTADEADMKRSGSGHSAADGKEGARTEPESGRSSADSETKTSGARTARGGSSLPKEARFADSEVSSMPGAFPDDENKSTPNSSYRRTASTTSQTSKNNSTLTDDTTTDSDATSVAPDRKNARRMPTIIPPNEPSPPFDDSHPPTPTQDHMFSPRSRATPIIDVGMANKNTIPSHTTPLTAKHIPPMPPPPPPPPTEPREVPRVDYLLKHGGLPYPVPKRLVQMGITNPVQQYNVYQSPALNQAAPIEEYAKVFSSIHKRLDDYLTVMEKHGSLAVATGYKSVARRLLDKLSQVFARDISSQRCDCVVCKTTPQPNLSDEEDSGVSWGEILEFVAGRRELPQWPPFSIQGEDGGLGMFGSTQAPMQKLDIDVPDEYRDHYIRQNQKTKRAVQNWLAQQPDFPSSPPEEADEDTLMFAMMTKLSVQQRNLFIALMHGQNFISEARAPTPAERPATSSNALRRAKKALQRLYRLDRPPRDCESAMYLLNNPHLHGMLATLAEVNEAEWEILISGRFDGFLWSGAEAPFPPSASGYNSPVASRGPSRGPNMTPFSRNMTPFSGLSGMQSRNTTPFSPLRNPMSPEPIQVPPTSMFPTRGPTPGPNGVGVAPPAPVQLDEDTEIAVAAELERNLFLDMERLEDAFEILHGRAELVRQMLRERSAGLSAQAQLRRGSNGFVDPVGVRLDTPASGITDFEDEDDDGLGDVASLAPDDSASQISVNRRHRPRRERKTPLPDALPEEDESVFEEDVRTRRERGGRRSKY